MKQKQIFCICIISIAILITGMIVRSRAATDGYMLSSKVMAKENASALEEIRADSGKSILEIGTQKQKRICK